MFQENTKKKPRAELARAFGREAAAKTSALSELLNREWYQFGQPDAAAPTPFTSRNVLVG